jgi:hypothetical protein
LRQPSDDLAGVLKGGGGGHGQAGLTRERTGAGRCGLQVLKVVTSVRPDGVRDVVAVRDATEQVKQIIGRRWERLAGVVVGHAHIVTDGAADQDGGSS